MGTVIGWLILATSIGQAGDAPRQRNRLANESSPYLRLHADNPVDWHAWNAEALATAKRLNRPILLSIGYSSCHWCHVMNRESFANAETAKLLNAEFVCIKVDREERPDLDMLYMEAVRAMSGQGGWPLTVFLLPDGRPFAGGTYFPPEDRKDETGAVVMLGFPTMLRKVVSVLRDQRKEIDGFADKLANHLRSAQQRPRSVNSTVTRATIDEALAELPKRCDAQFGGMARAPRFAPKFPQPGVGAFALATAKSSDEPAASAIAKQVEEMAAGGIFDQLAGGWHRYSTDREWIVPHFEKMLYDQGQMLSLLAALQARKPTELLRRAEALTVEFLEREMRSPGGLFYAALDADSEHEEGKFYAWTAEEFERLLGSDAGWFRHQTRTEGKPNFEGKFVLRLAPDFFHGKDTAAAKQQAMLWESCRSRLLAERLKRVRPLTDQKLIANWNGLAIVGLAEAARQFNDPNAKRLAIEAADAVLKILIDANGRLAHHAMDGKAMGRGFADDHAAIILALLAADRLQPNPRWRETAVRLGRALHADFWDPKERRIRFAGRENDSLLASLSDNYDGATPSATSLAAQSFVALAQATGDSQYAGQARQIFEAEAANVVQSPLAATTLLLAWQQLQATASAVANVNPKPNPGKDGPIAGIRLGAGDIVPIQIGKSTTISLEIQLAKGWHINANPAAPDYLKPTVVRIESSDGVELARVDYPPGKSLKLGGINEQVSAYEHTATIGITLRAAASARPGKRTLALVVDYQACDDHKCLPPTHIEAPLVVEVKAANGQL